MPVEHTDEYKLEVENMNRQRRVLSKLGSRHRLNVSLQTYLDM